ncbi:MAG: monooxygenase [Myxococcaceae bacterium]
MMIRTLSLSCALLVLAGCPSTGSSGDAGLDDVQGDGGTMTWYRDVLPIAQERCMGCHVEGGVAPFAMSSYAQVKNWQAAMASSVLLGNMPPWMPAKDCQSFKESRALEKWERDTIVVWSQQGAHEGDPKDAPPAKTAEAGLAWTDDTLQPAQSYTPNASLQDDYHCFVLNPTLPQARDLIGYEVTPGERRSVHHVILYSANAQDAAAKNQNGQGWTCFGGPETPNPVMLGGWVPGTFVTRFPETTGIRLAANSVIVMQVHYNLAAGALPDQTSAKLQYAKSPVAKPAVIVPQAQVTFAIPPAAMSHSTSVTNAIIPQAKTLWGVLPHMHTKGKSLNVSMGSECLIDIPKWDFHWQQLYFYEKPISLPSSGSLKLTCTWQNPTSKVVTWGEGTDDEMCLNYYFITQ